MQNSDELHLRAELRGHEEDVSALMSNMRHRSKSNATANELLFAGEGCDHLSFGARDSLARQNRQNLDRVKRSSLFTGQEPGNCLWVYRPNPCNPAD